MYHTRVKVILLLLAAFIIVMVYPSESSGNLSDDYTMAPSPKIEQMTDAYGIPSAEFEWSLNGVLSEEEKIYVQSLSPVSFTGLGVGWKIESANQVDAEQFEFHIRTRQAYGRFSSWYIVPGDYTPDKSSGIYWSELFLTHDGEAHDEFEIKVISPSDVAITYIRVSVADASNPDGPKILAQGGPAETFSTSSSDAHEIITREQWWGSLPAHEISAPGWLPVKISVTHSVLHHTATHNNPSNPAQAVRNIWSYHANSRGWGDIGYNFLIDQHGNIYQGRYNPWLDKTDVRGGHAYAANGASFGVGVLGQFQPGYHIPWGSPTPMAIAAFEKLCTWRFSQLNLNPLESSEILTGTPGKEVVRVVPRICGHRDVDQTSCPGDTLYAHLPTIRKNVSDMLNEMPPLITALKSNSSSPQPLGTTIRWACKAQGSNLQYRFRVYKGDTLLYKSPYSSSNKFYWEPEQPGDDYRIRAYVRNGNKVTVKRWSNFFTIENQAPVIVSLQSNSSSPQPLGTTIRWVCDAQGNNLQYRFRVYKGDTLLYKSPYSSSNTFDWKPDQPGDDYRIRAYVRNRNKVTVKRWSGYFYIYSF